MFWPGRIVMMGLMPLQLPEFSMPPKNAPTTSRADAFSNLFSRSNRVAPSDADPSAASSSRQRPASTSQSHSNETETAEPEPSSSQAKKKGRPANDPFVPSGYFYKGPGGGWLCRCCVNMRVKSARGVFITKECTSAELKRVRSHFEFQHI